MPTLNDDQRELRELRRENARLRKALARILKGQEGLEEATRRAREVSGSGGLIFVSHAAIRDAWTAMGETDGGPDDA